MSLRTQLRRYVVPLLAIVGLLGAAAAVGSYVLVHQRLRLPWDDVYAVQIELTTGQAITPGQGQTVSVAGVTVGEVADVSLREGRALVRLEIERDQLPEVHADARALVRPKTALQDMSIDLDPGSPRAPKLEEDDVLPVERTAPSVNLDEVLAGLDADVRPYLRGLLQGLGDGLARGGAEDLQRAFVRSQPLLRATRQLTDAVRGRRVELRRLVSSLARLSDRVAGQGDDLNALVSQGNATFGAVSAEDAALRASLRQLPGTLRAADRALAAARPLARDLTPAVAGLRPAARDLAPALRAARPLAREGSPAVAQLRGLSSEARPLARQLRGALDALAPATTDVRRAVDVLRYVANEVVANPEGPQEGYLFWLAWFAHNANSMLSTQDANGGWWRGQLVFSCSNLQQSSLLLPVLAPATQAGVCPG